MRISVILFVLVSIQAGSNAARAQRPHIFLPRTHGATVLSTYIDAEARRIVAMGDFLESQANARLTHTEADRQAIENAMLWVDTYFKRKERNQEYRRAQNPSYIEQEKRRDQVRERTILDLPSEVTNGDVTDDLNWLLDRLISESDSYELIFSETLGDVAHLDQTLTADEISHILLRESTGNEAGGQSFRADSVEFISVNWPLGLSDRAFAVEGAAYEKARLQAIAESSAGKLTIASWVHLQSALDQLTHKFNQVYSREALESASGNERILLRASGKRFLQAQAVGVARVFTAKDLDVLERKYTFTGSSVIDLVRHCGKHGLEFAPPTPDDRAVYRVLFNHLRQVYLELK